MRASIIALVLAAIAWPSADAGAQSVSALAVTRPYTVAGFGTALLLIQCPDGYASAGFSISRYSPGPAAPATLWLLDRSGAPVDATTVDIPATPPTGQAISIDNSNGVAPESGVIELFCVSTSVAPTTLQSRQNVPPQSDATVVGACPAGQVPVGQYSNVDGQRLVERSRAYAFGTAPSFTLLGEMPDGVTGPPAGIALGVSNATDKTLTARLFTNCVPLPAAQTIVSSVATTPGTVFLLPGGLPDGQDFIGYTAVGGPFGALQHAAVWGKDGSVSSQAPYALPSGATQTVAVRDIFADGIDTRRPGIVVKAAPRAVIGTLAIPSATAPQPPAIVTVVEFYNAALDHYFITAAAKEISDLDTGVHFGWQRTGQAFKAYGPGSTGPVGRRPVCRAYGNPAARLDSHFYSASPLECLATLAGFGGAWLLEASEVFQMNLPDAVTGACPAGTVPIYRVWNNRTDSNHRYVTTIALRDQMVARGYIAEGYGPDAVTLCAPQ